jgi:hypothetical protein
MRRAGSRNGVMRAVLYGSLLACAAGPACGKSGGVGGVQGRWTRIERVGRYTFEGGVVADKDLSGIACISDKYCLIGADETREVQVVELSRPTRTLRIMETLSLLRSGSEIDTEAIAAEGDCYYIVGSHGISKKQGERQSNRCSIFRLRVDPQTGLPKGPSKTDARVPAGLDVASLNDILRADPVLGPHVGQPLQQRGLNIEALAVRNGRLFIGFRNPNLNGYAFVMEIGAADVFASKPRPAYTLHRLRLGEGLGIRELVAAKSCFLLIAGNAGSEPSDKYAEAEDYEEDRDFFLFTWEGKGPDVHKIGPLPDVVAGAKAEAMTILEEAPDHLTVLILFDGAKGGRPTVYRID